MIKFNNVCKMNKVASFILAVCCNVTGSLVGPGTSFLDGECKETKAYFEIDFLAGLIKV